MRKISAFKKNPAVQAEGVWKRPDAGEDLEIKSRGFTDEYTDAQAAKQRQAAKGFGGDTEKLPAALKRKINVECLIKHSLVDVRGLEDDAGKSVKFDAFCEMLRSGDYPALVSAAFMAAALASDERESDLKEALGN